jgi:putative heme-binding domain-containing protein
VNTPLSAAPAQGLFGPKWWEGDAFVAGESRGKIWRVRLVKTPHGYVGREFLIARLSMLTMDLAISPKGDLYVCCHSGLPDWGTGPQGEGKIFKISYADPKAPQPVIAWAAGPTEARVAFDKAIDPSVTNTVVGQQIEFGEYVRAADRYEVFKPPYQVVKQQEAAPRGELKILTAKLDNGNQTLVLTTETHPQAVTYALKIPGVKANGKKGTGETAAVEYDLSGVSVNLVKNSLLNKLPDSVSQKIRSLSGNEWLDPNEGFKLWSYCPNFSIASNLFGSSFDQMLGTSQTRGISTDWFSVVFKLLVPPDAEKLQFSAQQPFDFTSNPTRTIKAPVATNGLYFLEFEANMFRPAADSLIILIAKGKVPISISYNVKNDANWRTLPLSSFRPRWFPSVTAPILVLNEKTELSGGDYENGRGLFFGDQLKCSTCHRLRGAGATIGPDLSNLASRDAASVLRDIKEPSASINPDYVAYNVTLSDGGELTGFIRAQDDASIKLIGADGKETQFHPTDVKEMRPSSVSLMPTGLIDALKGEQIRDLLTFLLNEPPKRGRAEIEAALSAGENHHSQIADRKLEIVLVASKQDHGPGQHDYPAWQTNWLHLFTSAGTNVTATAAWEWPSKEQFQTASAIIFYFWNHDWSAERYRQLDEYLERGGGVVVLHAATIADQEPEQLAERIGLASQPQRTKYRHTPLDLKIIAPADNPITLGLSRQIHFLDEPYWPMIGNAGKVEVLAATSVDGEDRPMIWTFQKGKGRVFASILGHYTWTHEDPLFRVIALRGLAWAMSEPTGRFEKLADVSATTR